MFDSQEMNQQTIPYQEPREPAPPPVPPRRRGGGLRTGAIIGLILVLVVVFGVGLFAGWEFGRNGSTLAPSAGQLPPLSGTTLDKVREAVVVKVTPAVVQVNVLTQNGGAIGSGVIIDSRGYIITNNHVVNGAQTIQVVLNDGTKLPAQLSGTDPPDDLAVLKIQPPGNMTVATIGDSSQLRVGQRCWQ